MRECSPQKQDSKVGGPLCEICHPRELHCKTRPSHSGRPRKCTAERVERMGESLQQSENLSSSCYFFCISVQEFFRDTKACPYRIQTRQTLTALDKQPRKAMVDKLLDKIEKYPEFLNLLWTLDKAYFNLERKGELKERKALRESSLHSALWGIWHDGTVTKEKYVEVVKAFNSDKSHACNRAPAKVLKRRSKVTPK